MGNIWTNIHSSNHNFLNDINESENCEQAVKKIKKLIKEIIKKLNNQKIIEKEYNLYPGQEIFYKNVLGIEKNLHTAIYLYKGLIIEICSGPKVCKNSCNFFTSFLGINTLKEFKKYGTKVRKSKIYKVETNEDHEKKVIIARLKRACKKIGIIPFNIFNYNCTQITHEIVFNQRNFPENCKFKIL